MVVVEMSSKGKLSQVILKVKLCHLQTEYEFNPPLCTSSPHVRGGYNKVSDSKSKTQLYIHAYTSIIFVCTTCLCMYVCIWVLKLCIYICICMYFMYVHAKPYKKTAK